MEKAVLVFCYPDENERSAVDFAAATLIVRMLSGGFCLAVAAKDGTVLDLHHYTFLPNLSFEQKIDIAADTVKNAHLQCAKTVFQLYTNINTQIPEEYYEEKLNSAIADLLVENSKNYVPIAEKIDNASLYNLSLWEAGLLKKVKQNFPQCELKTTMGSLLAKTANRKPQAEAFVFVEDNNFSILARSEKGLLGCNCFAFETEADFLYFCLYFLQGLYQNAETLTVKLCGNIAEQSPLYLALKKYFAKVELIENEDIPIENYHYYYDIV